MDSGPKIRKTETLHSGRESHGSVRYFVTLCVKDRKHVLADDTVTDVIRDELRRLSEAGDIRILEWVIMPDHVHLLFELGRRLTLGRVVVRLKVATRPVVRAAAAAWQRDFYEHRLRPEESAEAYAAYIFLNPYRAGLISPDEIWPHRGRGDTRWEFEARLRPGGLPHPEWIATVGKPSRL